jgi:hypothetical protein
MGGFDNSGGSGLKRAKTVWVPDGLATAAMASAMASQQRAGFCCAELESRSGVAAQAVVSDRDDRRRGPMRSDPMIRVDDGKRVCGVPPKRPMSMPVQQLDPWTAAGLWRALVVLLSGVARRALEAPLATDSGGDDGLA